MSVSSARARAGGTLAAHLARRGVDVAVVEGGPKINTRTDFNTHAMPFDFPDRAHPHHAAGRGRLRIRTLAAASAARLMTWNAVAWRLSHRDFKGRSIDGAGEDWPIDYDDLAPYYDNIEREVGVCGNLDHLEDLPDGVFLPPVPMKCSDLIVQARRGRSSASKSFTCARPRAASPSAARPACHFCGNCMAGCDVVAKYNSADVHMVPGAQDRQAGDLSQFHRARGHGLRRESRHRRAVSRPRTRAEGEVRGRSVVVACACVQSVALLLMSKSRLLSQRARQFQRRARPQFHPALHRRRAVLPQRPDRQARHQ